MHRHLRILPLLAATLALSTGALAAPMVGSQAPDVPLKDLSGNTFRLSQFRGHSPVLLNFFSVN